MIAIETDKEHGHVRVFADALLYDPAYTGNGIKPLYAMSIVGPEQAVRAVNAGCALEEKNADRVLLMAKAVNGSELIRLQYTGDWSCEAMMLSAGVLHSVARPVIKAGASEAVLFPAGPTDADRDEAIYEHLQRHYTTPLLSPDSPVPSEAAAARIWRMTLCARLVRESRCWTPLTGMTGQPDKSWASAGLLYLFQSRLDQIVSELLATKRLVIPAAVTEAAA